MIWALHSQSPPSFLALSCVTCWRMWGSWVQGSPSWPISWRERCPEHWSVRLFSGGLCFINEPIERVHAGGWSPLTAGSTLDRRPTEWMLLEAKERSLQGPQAVMYSPAGLDGGTFDKWTPLAELYRGDLGSGVGSWLVYLPTTMLASSSVLPPLSSDSYWLIMRPCSHEWMSPATKDTQVQAHASTHSHTAWLCWDTAVETSVTNYGGEGFGKIG